MYRPTPAWERKAPHLPFKYLGASTTINSNHIVQVNQWNSYREAIFICQNASKHFQSKTASYILSISLAQANLYQRQVSLDAFYLDMEADNLSHRNNFSSPSNKHADSKATGARLACLVHQRNSPAADLQQQRRQNGGIPGRQKVSAFSSRLLHQLFSYPTHTQQRPACSQRRSKLGVPHDRNAFLAKLFSPPPRSAKRRAWGHVIGMWATFLGGEGFASEVPRLR